MTTSNVDELLAAIRRLPAEARVRLLEQAAEQLHEDTPKPGAATEKGSSLLGLMSDEPEVVDHAYSLAYELRASGRMRTFDD